MQTKRITIVALAALFALITLVGARATSALRAQPTAVAVADLQEIFASLKEKTALEADLRSRGEKLQQEEQQRRKDIGQMRQDLEVLAPGTSAYQQKEEELSKAVLNLQVWSQFEQQKLNRERGLQIENLYRQSLDSISRVAQDNGYDLVLFKEGGPDFQYENAQQLSTLIQVRKVLYASDAVDITSQVIQRMNNEYDARQ